MNEIDEICERIYGMPNVQEQLSILLPEEKKEAVSQAIEWVRCSSSEKTVVLGLIQLKRLVMLHYEVVVVDDLQKTLRDVIQRFASTSSKIMHDASRLSALLYRKAAFVAYNSPTIVFSDFSNAWEEELMALLIPSNGVMVHLTEIVSAFSLHAPSGVCDIHGELFVRELLFLTRWFQNHLLQKVFSFVKTTSLINRSVLLLLMEVFTFLQDSFSEDGCIRHAILSGHLQDASFYDAIFGCLNSFPEEVLDIFCCLGSYRAFEVNGILCQYIRPLLSFDHPSVPRFFSVVCTQGWLNDASNAAEMMAYSLQAMSRFTHSRYVLMEMWSKSNCAVDRMMLVHAYLSSRIEQQEEDDAFCAEERMEEELGFVAQIICASPPSLLETIMTFHPSNERQQMWFELLLIAVCEKIVHEDEKKNLFQHFCGIVKTPLPLHPSIYTQTLLITLVENLLKWDMQFFGNKRAMSILMFGKIMALMPQMNHLQLLSRACNLLVKLACQMNVRLSDPSMAAFYGMQTSLFARVDGQKEAHDIRFSFYNAFVSLMNYDQLKHLLKGMAESMPAQNAPMTQWNSYLVDVRGVFQGSYHVGDNWRGFICALGFVLNHVLENRMVATSSFVKLMLALLREQTRHTKHFFGVVEKTMAILGMLNREGKWKWIIQLWHALFCHFMVKDDEKTETFYTLQCFYPEELKIMMALASQFPEWMARDETLRKRPSIVLLYYECISVYTILKPYGDAFLMDAIGRGLLETEAYFRSVRCILRLARKWYKRQSPPCSIQPWMETLYEKLKKSVVAKEHCWWCSNGFQALYALWLLDTTVPLEKESSDLSILSSWMRDISSFVRAGYEYERMVRSLDVDSYTPFSWHFTEIPDLSDALAQMQV